MKTISKDEFNSQPFHLKEIIDLLKNDKMICFPTRSGYKLAVDLTSKKAVTKIQQAKRRIRNAPALIFLPDDSYADPIVKSVSVTGTKLMKKFWPGSLTLLFSPGDKLHPKIKKMLSKAKGWIGLRVPDGEFSSAILKHFKKPLLVSSANLAKKGGANSVAQVKKNFGRTVDLMVEIGDIPPSAPSTLVDTTKENIKIIREGIIPIKEIEPVI